MGKTVELTVKKAYLVEVNTFLFNPLTTNVRTIEEYDISILKDQLKTGRGFKPLNENRYFYPLKDEINVIMSDNRGYVIDAFGDLRKAIKERKENKQISVKALHLITENVLTDWSFIKAQLLLENFELKLRLMEGIPRKLLILNLYKGNYLFVGEFIKETTENGDKYYQGYPLLCLRNFNPNKLKPFITTLLNTANGEIAFSFIILYDRKSFSLISEEKRKSLLLSPLPILDISEVEGERWLSESLKYFKKAKLCFKFSTLEKASKKIIEELKKKISTTA